MVLEIGLSEVGPYRDRTSGGATSHSDKSREVRAEHDISTVMEGFLDLAMSTVDTAQARATRLGGVPPTRRSRLV